MSLLTSAEKKEEVHVLWYDSNIDNTRARSNRINRLREIVSSVYFYDNEDSTIEAIQSITDETILFITSGQCGTSILSKVIHLKQINSIFIFCFKKKSFMSLKELSSKVIDIYIDFDRLLESIEALMMRHSESSKTFAILDHFHPSTQDLNQSSGQYEWFQLLKDLILRLPHREKYQENMIKLCQKYYRENETELKNIEDFNKNYRPENVFHWYTRESFVYKMINKALRSQDIDQLCNFSFIIADLSNRLRVEYVNTMKESVFPCTVYRGTQLKKSEVDRLIQSCDQLICSQSFWSTSRHPGRALTFTNKYPITDDIVPVLFEIECDADVASTGAIFADLSKCSVMNREQEVLFDISTSFCVKSIKIEKNIQVIQLKVAHNNGQSIAKTYFHDKYHGLSNDRIECSFAMLMLEIGHYRKAQEYLEQLLIDAKPDNRIWIELNLGRAKCCQGLVTEAKRHCDTAYELMKQFGSPRIQDSVATLIYLGLILQNEGNFRKALEKFQEALTLSQNNLSKDHIDIQRCLIAIGSCLNHLGRYNESLSSYQQALHLHTTYRSSVLPQRAVCLNNIGNVQVNLGLYRQALCSYEESLRIRQKNYPNNHHCIAETWLNIGNLYREQCQYTRALEFCQKGLDVLENYFTSDKIMIADALNSLARIYFDQQKYDQARETYERAWNIRMKFQHASHLDIALLHNNIGSCWIKKQQYDKAYQNCSQAVTIVNRNADSNQLIRATCLHNLALVHKNQGKQEEAMKCFATVLEIRRQFLPPNHPDIADTLNNIGIVYENLLKFSDALDYYSEALAIKERSLPSEHRSIASSCRNLAHLHVHLMNYSEALKFYQRCLDIDQKHWENNHESLVHDLYQMGIVCIEMKQNDDARTYLERAKSINDKIQPENDARRTAIENKLCFLVAE